MRYLPPKCIPSPPPSFSLSLQPVDVCLYVIFHLIYFLCLQLLELQTQWQGQQTALIEARENAQRRYDRDVEAAQKVSTGCCDQPFQSPTHQTKGICRVSPITPHLCSHTTPHMCSHMPPETFDSFSIASAPDANPLHTLLASIPCFSPSLST